MPAFFSIITPVYNAEKYIEKCIESILGQTFSDFELLLINDGSLDNSSELCESYAVKDTRIAVYHKINGGVSSARNFGLDKATGQYIIFLDSDDYFTPETLAICKEIISKNTLDILQFSLQGVLSNGTPSNKTTIRQDTTETFSPDDYLKKGQLQVCAGGSCIRRSIIEDYGIRFDEKIKLAEDQLFIISSILHSKRIKYEDIVLYNYLDNPESATHINKSKDVTNSIKALEEFIKDNPISKDILNRQILNFVCILLRNRDMTTNEISKIVKNKSFKYSKRLRIGEKIFCILSKISFGSACFMTRILFSLYYRNN